MYDLGGANSFLSLQAVELGLQVRQIAGFNHEKTIELLRIPETLQPGVFIVVGYPGDHDCPEHIKRVNWHRAKDFYNESCHHDTC